MYGRVRRLKDVLWFLAFFGLVAAVFRMWYGLGATTRLSDAMPWGLWKILNMVAGVAVSTGGFTVGFLVYVLGLERFRKLVKPAILIAFLGYGSSCTALLLDIGLPQRFWHPIFMWNEHSFLFEVFWCVLLYFTVTFLELAPTISERFGWKNLSHNIHRAAFGIVVTGISLSSLHHSSLGSLFLATPLRLHPLWYSRLLPVFFITSAAAAGMMFVVLVRILYAIGFESNAAGGGEKQRTCCIGEEAPRPRLRIKDTSALESLATIAAAILGVYLAIKGYDLVATGKWRLLLAGTWESFLFLFELLIAAVIPIVLVSIRRTRTSPAGLGSAAFSAAAGLGLNRLDVGIFGYFRDAGTVYFPSLAEWAVSLGVVAAAALVFLFVSENFAIFDEGWKERSVAAGMFRSEFDSLSRVWNMVLSSGLERTTVIAVFTIPLAWIVLYPPFSATAGGEIVQPARGVDELRTSLHIDGNHAGLATVFPHADHQKRLGEKSSCGKCHHLSMPGDKNTPCSRCHRRMYRSALFFDHSSHVRAVAVKEKLGGIHPANLSCPVCHSGDLARTARNAKACLECHREDMHYSDNVALEGDFVQAASYQSAMHKLCLTCHRREAEKPDHKGLDDCSTCHKSMRLNPEASLARAERSVR